MKLKNLDVVNFRNHAQTAFKCGDKVNVLIGQNGHGKTNLLEAISYLSLTKSFSGSNDSVVLQIGKSEFGVSGEFVADKGIQYRVGIKYDANAKEKGFSVNRSEVQRFADVIGQFPVVVLYPESAAITLGSPADRRKFMDFVIAQSSRVYLEDLLEYRRILKQRNRILLDSRTARNNCQPALDPWNAGLVDRGVRIMTKRKEFVQSLQPLAQSTYTTLAGRMETPTIEYRPSVEIGEADSEESIRRRYEKQLNNSMAEEVQTGLTLTGPHRDELELKIDGLSLRKYASQGQHKTALIALKVAEFFYLQGQRNETPLLLLDDIFGELDAGRSERLMNLVKTLGQAFITTATESVFPSKVDWMDGCARFLVQNGTVTYA